MASVSPRIRGARRRARGRAQAALRAVVRPRGLQRVTGVVDAVRDYVVDELGEAERFQWLRDAVDLDRPPPRTVGEPAPPLEALAHHRHPGAFRAVLPGARIAGVEPLVLTADRRALLESTFDREQLEANPVLRRRLHPAVRRAGRHVCLISQWSSGYFHWMLDTLPRLALLDPAEDAPIVVHDRPAPFVLDSLAAAGVAADRLVAFDGTQMQVDELVFPSLVGRTGHPPAWALDWLAERLAPSAPGPPRRLYVSRADATWRRVVDEPRVEAVLARRGFETLLPGELSLAEQMAAFAAAEAVVAPHGAGLVNLLAARGAKVLELLPRTWLNGCYYALSAARGLDYSYLVCAARGSHDLVVDLAALERALDAAGL